MASKTKSLSIKKLKIATVDTATGESERRVSFVASTATEDRDYEVVNIGTFRLPLKGGGEIVVKDLPAEGAENIDIPFLTNHDLWDVASTIGSVRKASFEDGKLIFEVGISSRDYAQDMFKLIEEGHLDNAFSIQYRDFSHNAETNTDEGGEIVEVSLVTRGSNKDAQVLAVKALKPKGEEMPEEEVKESVEIKEEKVEEPATEPVKEEAEEKQTENAEIKEEEAEEADNKEKIMKELNNKEVAAGQVKMPSQIVTSANTASDYLKSKAAVLDYAKVSKRCGGDKAVFQEAWKEHLNSKGITVTGGDFTPTNIEQVMFKAWYDEVGAISTFRRTRARASKFYAMTTSSTALGHKKGDTKADQTITAIPRNAGLKTVYKKLPIDWIDIVNDESGELYTFRERELYDRVLHAIVRGAIFGDGLSAPSGQTADYRIFDGTNGLYPMAADITGSGTSSSYAATVATQIANSASDNIYAKIVKTIAAVKTSTTGERKVLVVPEGTIAGLYLLTNDNGGYLFAPGTDFRQVFGVSYIIEGDQADFTRVKLDVIAYRESAYTLGGPDSTVRNWFDGNMNLDYMMVEQPVYGSLEGYKAAAGYASAAE